MLFYPPSAKWGRDGMRSSGAIMLPPATHCCSFHTTSGRKVVERYLWCKPTENVADVLRRCLRGNVELVSVELLGTQRDYPRQVKVTFKGRFQWERQSEKECSKVSPL